MEYLKNQVLLLSSSHFVLCNKLFGYMCPMVLEWCPETCQFSTKGRGHSQYWLWYFNIFIIVGLIGFGSCLVVMTHPKESGIAAVIISCFLAACSFLVWSSVAILSWHAETIVNGMSGVRKFWKKLETVSAHEKWPPQPLFHELFWQLVYLFQKLLFIIFFVLPFILTPLIIFVEMDPFYFTMPKIFNFFRNDFASVSGWFTFALRMFLGFVCVAESCRFLVVYLFIVLVYYEETIIRIIELLKGIPLQRKKQDLFITLYLALNLAHQSMLEPVNTLIGNLMGIGFLIFVTCNVAAIKAFGLVPLQVYWLLPLVSIIVGFTIYILLPLIIVIHVQSDRLIKKRTRISIATSAFSRHERRLTKRRFVAIRPLVYSCGSFYTLEYGMEATFFYCAIYRTADCCVMLSL